MFDHIAPVHDKKVRLGIHHHGGIFIVVVTSIATALIVIGVLFSKDSSIVTLARETSVSIQLIDRGIERFMVGPLVSYPLATFHMSVHEHAATLGEVSFLLDGVYDVHDLRGVSLYINGTQIGSPVQPDEFGVVTFPSDGISLSPREHTVDIQISTLSATAPMSVKAIFENESSFNFFNVETDRIEFGLPYETSIVRLIDKGRLGAFVKRESGGRASEQWTNLYMYADAEDARLQRLIFSGPSDFDGVRLDAFIDDSFVSSGVFVDGEAALDFTNIPRTIIRGRNTMLQLFLIPAGPGSLATMNDLSLERIEARGAQSGVELVMEANLSLL